MASIRKYRKGYRAEISRQGRRSSKVFATRQEAKDWAAHQEYLILNHVEVAASGTFGEMLERYANTVSVKKRGARWEMVRIAKLCRDKIASVKMGDLRPSDFSDWRDRRSREVAPASVIREMQLMSTALNTARKEWGLISTNPVSDVRRPVKPQPRDRLPTDAEIERLRFSAGNDLSKATARAFHAFLFAIETAMRAGEIAGLEWDRIDLDRRVARLIHTKNGRRREVPLSSEAIRLLQALPQADPVFGISSRQLDVLWRKLRDRAGVVGLNFHDSRAEAILRLSKKLAVLDLARMTGHTDLTMLIRVYYRESAENIAKLL